MTTYRTIKYKDIVEALITHRLEKDFDMVEIHHKLAVINTTNEEKEARIKLILDTVKLIKKDLDTVHGV